MEKILTLIVPAYNVERYLVKCLESFVVKAIMAKIEVLIINDGSTDTTKDIAEQYCNRFPETFFLYNKSNGGHGSAINYGVKKANGKYFRIVDGDDWLNTDKLNEFVKILEHTDADIVASNFLCIQDETGKILESRKCTNCKEYYGQSIPITELNQKQPVIKMHSFTCKLEIFKKNDIKIDEFRYYVDCEYTIFPIPYVENIYFCDLYLYMYRLGRKGQSVDIASMQRNRKNHRDMLNKLFEYYENHKNVGKEKKTYMERGIALAVENQFQIFISMGQKEGIQKEMVEFDLVLKQKHPGIYNAVGKKSIWMLRKTGYRILPFATIVYKIVKR